MKFLPTYPDARLVKTVKKSVDVLDAPAALMIFPENSNAGYHDMLTEFFPGFVLVMERYRQVKGADLPVRPVYYHRKKRLIVVGEPCFLGEFEEKGMRRGDLSAEGERALPKDRARRIRQQKNEEREIISLLIRYLGERGR